MAAMPQRPSPSDSASSPGQVVLLATLDTKGAEAEFLRSLLNAAGVSVRLVDTGSLDPPIVTPDVPREAVFAAAGANWHEVAARRDRGEAVSLAAAGAAALVTEWHAAGQLAGVLSLGGSAGTTIGAAAMRALPIGVPKLVVSTLASGQTRHYVGAKDICLLHAVVDFAGINSVSRKVLANAAHAMAGMVRHRPPADVADRPLVATSMFGVTTPCVQHARRILEQAGYEVLVFHATGTGGEALETLAADGLLAGVLDITTTELADELVGGVLSAGQKRLTAAGRAGVPQVVSVGATDMVNFHAPETVPEKFRGRTFYPHNPSVTLMRTTADENAQLGREIGSKVAAARGPAVILLPAEGVSALDRAGQPFCDPLARRALFDGVRQTAGRIEVCELPWHINDEPFAQQAAERLLAMMAQSRRPSEGVAR